MGVYVEQKDQLIMYQANWDGRGETLPGIV